MSDVLIRLIQPQDNEAIRELVFDTLEEFGAVGEGYASSDEELNDMFQCYQAQDRCFYVVEMHGQVLGCGGFAPLDGDGDKGVCELRKMYFDSIIRGQGFGKQLIDLCIEQARTLKYHTMYLETTPKMTNAQNLYQSRDFKYLENSKGNTCHHACDVYMAKKL